MAKKKDFNKPAKKAEKPRRDAGTWIGIISLVGMGMICSAGALGGIALAVTAMGTNSGMVFGGLMLTCGMGYILPYIVQGINELIDPKPKEAKKTDLKNAGI